MVISISGILVLDQCRQRGIELYVDGGQVRWKTRPGAMDIQLLRSVKAHQADLVEALEAKQRRCEPKEGWSS